MAVVRAAFLACGLLFLLLAATGFGAESGADPFGDGVKAFHRGDYAAAAKRFEQALAAGLDTPALRYNLGASLYKLGRYAEAEAAFGAIAADPAWSALAWYNMALSAHQRGADARAREYAENARRNAAAGEVRTLAAALLERLGAGRRSARGRVQIYLGHDSNVTLTADDQTLEATRMADAFLQLQASADGDLGTGGARWEASLYSVNYRDLSDNDITQLRLGASRPVDYAGWQWDAGVRWRYLWLAGQGLQQVGTLALEGTRALERQRELRAEAQVSTIDTVDSAFEFLDGSRQQLDLSLGQPVGGGWLSTGLSWERNNRADLATGADFFSFSSTRYGAWASGSWPLAAAWRLEPYAIYYRARYADAELRAGVPSGTRTDAHLELALRARRQLSAAWELLAEYVYIENDSNLRDFNYNQRLILLGLASSL